MQLFLNGLRGTLQILPPHHIFCSQLCSICSFSAGVPLDGVPCVKVVGVNPGLSGFFVVLATTGIILALSGIISHMMLRNKAYASHSSAPYPLSLSPYLPLSSSPLPTSSLMYLPPLSPSTTPFIIIYFSSLLHILNFHPPPS